MAEFPGFTIWTDAYLADTGHLTTVEHGAYFLLLMTMWRAGGYLPNDDVKLARFCRCTPKEWDKIRDHLLEFFTIDGNQITQGRLLDELDKARARSKQASDNARAKYRKTKKVAPADAKRTVSETPAERLPNASETDASISITITNKEKEPSAPKKGTRIPDDFLPDLVFARSEGMTASQAEKEAANFRDYWTAKSGKDATKVDWPATWRGWVRRAVERRGGSAPVKSDYRRHQEEVDRSFREAIYGTGHHNDDDGQPAFELEPGNFRSDRSAAAGKR